MGLDGMYRTILFSVLRQCPYLIPEIFEQQWREMGTGSPNPALEADLFRTPKIAKAFNTLLDLSSRSHNLRFCFFLDGLDEYDADSHDQRVFARRLRDWARSENVKICVTSRPEVQFMDTFMDSRIHLHELTDCDIYQSTMDAFEKDESFTHLSMFYLEFVKDIVRLAEGVFLWARLVVKILLSEAALQSSYQRLRQKLHSTPPQLDELYASMFSSLPRDDIKRLHFLFLMVASNPFEEPLNATLFDYINSSGHLDTSSKRPYYNTYQAIQDQERIEKQLQDLTKGLLVLVPPKRGSAYFNLSIQGIGFLHRSVKEYVLHAPQMSDLESNSPNFDQIDTHAMFRIIELSRIHLWNVTRPSDLVKYFIDVLSLGTQLKHDILKLLEQEWERNFRVFWRFTSISIGGDPAEDLSEVRAAVGALPVQNSFLLPATTYGHIGFLRKRSYQLSLRPTKPEGGAAKMQRTIVNVIDQDPSVLLCAITALQSLEGNNNEADEIIKLLISHGHSLKRHVRIFNGDTDCPAIDYSVSLWTLFLCRMAECIFGPVVVHALAPNEEKRLSKRLKNVILPRHLQALKTILLSGRQEAAVFLVSIYARGAPREIWALSLEEVVLATSPSEVRTGLLQLIQKHDHGTEEKLKLFNWLRSEKHDDLNSECLRGAISTRIPWGKYTKDSGADIVLLGVCTRVDMLLEPARWDVRIW